MGRVLNKLLLNHLTLRCRPFFKRYPFRSPVSIQSSNERGAVDLEYGFFCNRIPKAANSTVVSTLATIKFGHAVPSRDAKKIFLTPGHLNREQVAEFDSLFRFTVVRNPFSRTLSAYLDKIHRTAEKQGKQAISFEQFLDRLENEPRFLYSNAHWAPQSSLLLIPVPEFDFIGKVESLNEDIAFIQQKLKPDTIAAMNSAGPKPTGASKKLLAYYKSPRQIEQVQRLFKQDFDAFGYSTQLPV